MSESTPETPVEAVEQPQEGDPKTFTEDYVKDLRKEAARHRTEARNAQTELEQLRAASLTETERAIAEAEQRGRSAAATEFGQVLAREKFIAAAARRNADFDATAVLDDLNFARYLGEDGLPDSDAIAQAADRLVPVSTAYSGIPRPDPSQGPRTTANGSTADQFAAAVSPFL